MDKKSTILWHNRGLTSLIPLNSLIPKSLNRGSSYTEHFKIMSTPKPMYDVKRNDTVVLGFTFV